MTVYGTYQDNDTFRRGKWTEQNSVCWTYSVHIVSFWCCLVTIKLETQLPKYVQQSMNQYFKFKKMW